MAWCLQQTLVLTDVGGILRLSEALSERKTACSHPWIIYGLNRKVYC